MWARVVPALLLLVLLCAGCSEQPSAGEPADTNLRAARNVTLHERKPDVSPATITARELVEQADHTVKLNSFCLRQTDRLTVRGERALFDNENNILTIEGPATLETADGMSFHVTGLVWDRRSQRASTANPVQVRSGEGTITASRAEFYDDFAHIRMIGKVHAKISSVYLDR